MALATVARLGVGVPGLAAQASFQPVGKRFRGTDILENGAFVVDADDVRLVVRVVEEDEEEAEEEVAEDDDEEEEEEDDEEEEENEGGDADEEEEE